MYRTNRAYHDSFVLTGLVVRMGRVLIGADGGSFPSFVVGPSMSAEVSEVSEVTEVVCGIACATSSMPAVHPAVHPAAHCAMSRTMSFTNMMRRS